MAVQARTKTEWSICVVAETTLTVVVKTSGRLVQVTGKQVATGTQEWWMRRPLVVAMVVGVG